MQAMPKTYVIAVLAAVMALVSGLTALYQTQLGSVNALRVQVAEHMQREKQWLRTVAEYERSAVLRHAAEVTARHMAPLNEQNPTIFLNNRSTSFTPQPPLTIDMLQRSRANVGDRKMWEHALCVAQRGGTVQVLVIGGSLTAGAELAEGKASAWPELLQKHFLQWYGTDKVKVINEARSSSGSDYWVKHLPSIWAKATANADATIIMVENGLNDATSCVGVGERYGSVDEVSMWWERLLRMILAFQDDKGNSVGLVVVEGFVPKDVSPGYGFSAGQNHHDSVSRYYEVPVISQRDAIWHPRFRQEIPVDSTAFDAKRSLRCMFPGQCVSMGSKGHGWDAFCDLCGRKMGGAHPNEDGQRAYFDLIAYNWHIEERGIQCSVGGPLDSSTGFHPPATGPDGQAPCMHDKCDTFSDLPLTHLSSFQQSADIASAFAEAAITVKSDEKIEGYWRFEEDKAGKGFGWIATGESSGRIMFPIKMKQGTLRIGYLFAYDNMARVSLFLATLGHKKKVLRRISSSKTIDSLVNGKFSGYKGESFDFSKQVQRVLTNTTEDTEPLRFVVVIVHKPPRLAPNSNTSCPQRGQNKFKLLDIQSF